jgi:hypothetical protein
MNEITNATQLYDLGLDLQKEIHDHEAAAFKLRREYQTAQVQMSALVALARYDLKAGEVIKVWHKHWRKTEEFRMRIVYFNASGPDDPHPSIHGILVKADGSLGTREKNAYPSMPDEYRWEKASD